LGVGCCGFGVWGLGFEGVEEGLKEFRVSLRGHEDDQGFNRVWGLLKRKALTRLQS